MLTEAEAKTKWCPLARSVIDAPGYASGNRFGNEALMGTTMCIASACMAWRIADSGLEIHSDNGRTVTREKSPEGEGWERGPRNMYWQRRRADPRGYCGVFGKPE